MTRIIRFVLGTAVVSLLASPVQAATITVWVSGNDCGNPNCIANETGTYANTSGQVGSPFIIKFGQDGSVSEINTLLFPSLTGAEFDFTPDLTGSLGSGSWIYTPGPGDPAIRFWAAKGGPNYNLFYDNGLDGVGGAVPVTSGTWAVPINPNNNKPYGFSHISFFDTAVPTTSVPEPSMLLLFGAAAAAGLRARARRK